MKCRILALCAMTLVVANAANAAVLFNNITGVSSAGSSGPTDGGSTLIMGDSFTSAAPDFSSIKLLLAKANPTTTGSTLIYLVPDNGSGAGTGQFGLPTFENNAGAFTSLAGSQLIATVLDQSLTSTLSPVSIWLNPTVTSSNHEYWVVAITNASSSFEWSYAADASGLGTSGQGWLNDFAGSNLLPVADSFGPYQMLVATPEPATIAILGAGLAGLGLFRRGTAKKT